MNDRFIFQDTHCECHAGRIIRTERCSVRMNPIAVTQDVNRIFFEIMNHIGVLLAHHIHMRLQDHGRRVLISRGCRLLDNEVVRLILIAFKV